MYVCHRYMSVSECVRVYEPISVSVCHVWNCDSMQVYASICVRENVHEGMCECVCETVWKCAWVYMWVWVGGYVCRGAHVNTCRSCCWQQNTSNKPKGWGIPTAQKKIKNGNTEGIISIATWILWDLLDQNHVQCQSLFLNGPLEAFLSIYSLLLLSLIAKGKRNSSSITY